MKEFELLQCAGKYAQQSHTENAEPELHLHLLQRALCEGSSIAAGSRTLIAMRERADTLLGRRHGTALGPHCYSGCTKPSQALGLSKALTRIRYRLLSTQSLSHTSAIAGTSAQQILLLRILLTCVVTNIQSISLYSS